MLLEFRQINHKCLSKENINRPMTICITLNTPFKIKDLVKNDYEIKLQFQNLDKLKIWNKS